MNFRMHERGLHYFNPRDEDFTFVNTVYDNKEGSAARHIKVVEDDRYLYNKIIYPSVKDYKRLLCGKQIKNFPLMVQDVSVAKRVWGNILLY